jgi:hypothetical protein
MIPFALEFREGWWHLDAARLRQTRFCDYALISRQSGDRQPILAGTP